MGIKHFLFFAIFALFLFLKSGLAAYADNSSEQVTLSDAVFADLALQGYLGNVSVYSYNGNDLDTVSVDAQKQWLPASTVKTLVAMYAFNQVSKKKLSLSDQFTIDDKNVVPNELVTDELPDLSAGDSISLQRLIEQMITQSDNTSFNTLLDILGRDKITAFAHTIGLKHTYIGSKLNLDTSQEQYEFNSPGYGINTITAEDYARAFVLIKKNKIPGSSDMYKVLSRQKINDMIPLLLPKNIVVAHKTGDLAPLYHDGGIVEAPTGTYILSIFTNTNDPGVVAHISELIYTKNFDLVGVASKVKALGEEPAHGIDPLVLNPKEANTKVLGINTTSIPVPQISAADIGISANDLSLTIPSSTLPKLTIPFDSPLHMVLPVWDIARYMFAKGDKARIQVVIDSFERQISEAKDLAARGKTTTANQIMGSISPQLNRLVQDKSIVSDVKSQTSVKAVVQTSISVLGSEYYSEPSKAVKLKLIKEIAGIAKNNVANIEPFIPKATNASNPAQRVLLGEVVSNNGTTLTVKTAGGQTVSVPTDNSLLKVRSDDPAMPSSINSVTTGTTVALAGSTSGNEFVPSFALTNVPRQLIAPIPVTVVKVNTKNKTIVVVENGTPLQVNIGKDTIIKAKDTAIPLSQVKTGDVVMVYGTVAKPSQAKQTFPIVITTTPPAGISPQAKSNGQSTFIQQGVPTVAQKNSIQPTPVITSAVNPQQNSTAKTAITPQTSAPVTQPVIIQGTTVQVVETRPVKQQSNPVQPQVPQSKPNNNQAPPPLIIPVDKKK